MHMSNPLLSHIYLLLETLGIQVHPYFIPRSDYWPIWDGGYSSFEDDTAPLLPPSHPLARVASSRASKSIV